VTEGIIITLVVTCVAVSIS